jgi:hypothetical protein
MPSVRAAENPRHAGQCRHAKACMLAHTKACMLGPCRTATVTRPVPVGSHAPGECRHDRNQRMAGFGPAGDAAGRGAVSAWLMCAATHAARGSRGRS